MVTKTHEAVKEYRKRKLFYDLVKYHRGTKYANRKGKKGVLKSKSEDPSNEIETGIEEYETNDS